MHAISVSMNKWLHSYRVQNITDSDSSRSTDGFPYMV